MVDGGLSATRARAARCGGRRAEPGCKRLVLHCGSGVRSEKVGRQCLADGISKIAHMAGGFAAWKEAKLPHIGTEMSSGAPKRVDPAAQG